MPERRSALLLRTMHSIVGSSLARVVDSGDGWPGLVDVQTDIGIVQLAVHIGPLTSSQRGRDSVERRFQNPGSERPVTAPQGAVPVLLGLWEEGSIPVIVAANAQQRLGRPTRYSIFIPIQLLEQAERIGWAQQYNTSEELLTAFHPALLPVFAAAAKYQIVVPPRQIETVLEASGFVETDSATIAERARRVSTRLVRDAEFGRLVCGEYDSLCAMCGLNFSLAQGAHIYPASAPNSNDSVWNGISLCSNHHTAFDRHQIFVDPESFKLSLHDDLKREANRNAACENFISTTFSALVIPTAHHAKPRSEMFERRYSFFNPKYNWAGWDS